MMKEIEIGEKNLVYYKGLRLITPKLANELGIPTEAPVFVSPYLEEADVCSYCNIEYKPLIYPVGDIVKAHHWHKSSGGIYYFRVEENRFGTPTGSSWIAILKPIGRILRHGYNYPYDVEKRSKQVLVEEIKAFCDIDQTELKEGVVYSTSYEPDVLLTICGSEEIYPNDGDKARFNFKITDSGEVLFSQIQPNDTIGLDNMT